MRTHGLNPWLFKLTLLVCNSQVENNTKGAMFSFRLRRCGTGVGTPHWCLLGVIAAGRKFPTRYRQVDEWGVELAATVRPAAGAGRVSSCHRN
jgi:hypothetical protein